MFLSYTEPGPRCQSSNSYSSGPRNSRPAAPTPRGSYVGQVRSEVPGSSTNRPIQRQQAPRSCNPPASNTAWSHTPVQQPVPQQFGK